MKIPAIRASIGDWIYYVATLSFKDISNYVKRIDDELHKSKLLSDMLQRSITENYKSIATYIETHNERFFNALILAVYDGDPQWHEIRIEYEDGEEFINLGLLELTGNEKIFPIDGQHRVEGIKKVINDSEKYNDEHIPVVFVGHRKDENGMRRARQLFSTLNRYAKPVSMRDIVALDEDDAVAIVSRDLIDEHSLFKSGRILDTKNKAIPDNNKEALTSIITFYECNRELLSYYLKENKKAGKKSVSIKDYIRIRPNDEELNNYKKLCYNFWDSMVMKLDCIKDINEHPDKSVEEYRNSEGGNILFRPVVLLPFFKAIVRLSTEKHLSFSESIGMVSKDIYRITHPAWKWIIWNPDKKSMIMGPKAIIELILLYFSDKTILTEKENIKLLEELRSRNQLSNIEDVYENILNI